MRRAHKNDEEYLGTRSRINATEALPGRTAWINRDYLAGVSLPTIPFSGCLAPKPPQ